MGRLLERPARRGLSLRGRDGSGALRDRDRDEDYTGDVTVEAFTHLPARDGGEEGEDDYLLAACRIDGARRTWATTDDPDLLRAIHHEEIGGRPGRVRPGGVLELR
ncbi:MAG TPA: hypothetical protein VKH41_13220 [Myxococcota bacterium]|nr:hypothetical protein [Myxococcota bacterium]